MQEKNLVEGQSVYVVIRDEKENAGVCSPFLLIKGGYKLKQGEKMGHDSSVPQEGTREE